MKKTKENKKFGFWSYFLKYKWGLILYILIFALATGIDIFFTIYLAKILTKISTGCYIEAIKMIIIFLSIYAFNKLIITARNILYTKMGNKITNKMRADLAVQAFKISDQAYSDHSTANFIKRISADPSTIYSNLLSFVSYFADIISCFVPIVYIFSIDYRFGLIAVVTIAIAFYFEIFKRKIYKKNRKQLDKLSEKNSSLMHEVIESQRDIKSLNLEGSLKNKIITSYNETAKLSEKTSITNVNISQAKMLVVTILSYIILILSLKFANEGFITLASVMFVYTNRRQIGSMAEILSNLFSHSNEIQIALARINELFEDEEYSLEKFGNTRLNVSKNGGRRIEFKNVDFSYTTYVDRPEIEVLKERKRNKKLKINKHVPTRIATAQNKVFSNLNFEIQPNITVAFVGKSGSGKSTILNLISKIYTVDNGKVLIDGQNIKTLDKQSLRDTITLVNQSPYIFDMTIKENLLLAKPDATDEEIEQAIKESALTEFVDSLPNKIETRVGESGVKLSGGQRQRLAIARAMLRKSSIILFDESTSALDNLAQQQIKQSIDSIKGKSTVVIVAHRLTTIKNVDKIFFLENGEIVDTGTFDELLNRNSNFKTMFLAENL